MNKAERTILWSFSLIGFFLPCVLFALILISHAKLGQTIDLHKGTLARCRC
jgi:hypothetical protein